MTPRQQLIETVAQRILALPQKGIVRVGVDGESGAGKTTFGGELHAALRLSGRPVIRASVDSFHHPREIRYRLGKTSPDGFFLDSYNYDALRTSLLDPLSPGGSARFRRAAFDHRTDSPVSAPEEHAPAEAILICDGLFLLRPELRGYWDYAIFLDVTTRTGLLRCAQRGDGSPDPAAPSNYRYVEGHQRYLRECRPKDFATLVIHNENLENPTIENAHGKENS